MQRARRDDRPLRGGGRQDQAQYEEFREAQPNQWPDPDGGHAVGPRAQLGDYGYERDFYGTGEGRGSGAGARRYSDLEGGYMGGGYSGSDYGHGREQRDFRGQHLPGAEGQLDRPRFDEWSRPEFVDRNRGIGNRDDSRSFGNDFAPNSGTQVRYDSRYGNGYQERVSSRDGRWQDATATRQTQGTFAGRGPKGYQRSDERLQEEISDLLMRDEHIDASEIEIQVRNGVVSLEGTIGDRRLKHRVEDLVDDVMGVKDIKNQLRIARGNQPEDNQQRDSRSGNGTENDASRGGSLGARSSRKQDTKNGSQASAEQHG